MSTISMDNPQYYQPLSHALHPPRSSSQPQFYKPPAVEQPPPPAPLPEQQKVIESDDDDEGMVEEQLSRTSAPPPSPKQPQAAPDQPHEPRRRGRPRGSKNRRGRISSQNAKPSPTHQQLHTTNQGSNPPQLPEVTAQNQQYYEFQWRVLNLCAEFYGAAEELVKGTPALVIAQCYQMGPSSKVDPLIMLSEAKQNCDTLLANPSRLITSPPPPPMYPVVPPFYPTGVPPPTQTTSSGVPAGAPTMISQPQTFVVPMSNHAYYAPPPPPPSQYPTTSYYSYPYGHPGAYYTPAVPPPPAPPPAATNAPPPTVSVTTSVMGTSGAWSDEEIERLKALAEEKRNSSGEIDWDAITSRWGGTRTRHQILIKATQLGLKESSSVRGVKRRRETENNGDHSSSTTQTPTPTATVPAPAVRHPSSTPSSTPVASPSLTNQQQPSASTSKGPAPISTSTTPASQPWPMPVVAVNTSSPVIGSSNSDHRVTSYYRPRPTDPSSRPSSSAGQSQLPTVHRYMYQPNGHHSENAK
ncbi:hypothetical protein EV361DRAFT_899735 [Lentinula raphanica]|uniref:Uncharacterized protein n=1 Tax=Lentinula raphanica TaxID=153919 RepID=A0AA38UKN3_9AGAR|nr:hypothetical protein F5880DRAFT_1519143 [Lentinula raphanica]KAJ3844769.1 hypothetical protein F5878DRAFT_572875 [Lentinula raphanica]KAJ3973512.1 hypothetical protein EV361DRAFT_899735 [Lentinula raphanica]